MGHYEDKVVRSLTRLPFVQLGRERWDHAPDEVDQVCVLLSDHRVALSLLKYRSVYCVQKYRSTLSTYLPILLTSEIAGIMILIPVSTLR